LPVDQDTATSLVTTLSSVDSERVVEDKAGDPAQYGLKVPAVRVSVTKKDGKSQTLLIGDDTPTGGSQFAMLEGDPRVFTISNYTKTSLDKGPNDLRDKRLLTFNSDQLARVELQAKGKTIEFAKNAQNDWMILKPKPMRADGSTVEDLVRKLKDAKMDLSGDSEKNADKEFGSAAKVGTAMVSDAAGNQTIEVRKDKSNNYWAKSSVLQGCYKTSSDLGSALDKPVDDYRNKKVFDFSWNDPSKMEIRNGPAAAPVVYQKSGDKWTSGPKQIDGPSVQSMIDKLRDLSANKFADGGNAGSPLFEATVTSNDGKRVEKVTLSKQGNTYYAKRENEPTLYEITQAAFEGLQKAASEVKEAQPAKNEKK
jgi:hypothetical protein